MKTLSIPFAFLILCAACSKQEMPKPLDSNSSLSTARVIGDTVLPIIDLPLGEHRPLSNHIGPRNPRPEQSASRSSGDTLTKVTLYPGEHKPLKNNTGPVKPRK